jgi:hypothetical protein
MSETAVNETTTTEVALNDALLTGLPRSGTTLTCELLNLVEDTVALDEPMDWMSFTAGDIFGSLTEDQACANVASFLSGTRRSILEHGVAYTKHVEGKVTGRKISDIVDKDQVRVGLTERGEITIDKPLTPDFRLVVKQVAAFTALLEPLRERFDVYAMVRNPLAVLSSWQTVPMPVRKGHVPFGEVLDRSLAQSLKAIDDPLDRQLHLLGWFFGRFQDLLPASSVFRYEDIVDQGGRPLQQISAGAADLDVTLNSRNHDQGTRTPAEVTRKVGAKLLATDGPWWHFYSRATVQEMLHAVE